MPGHRPDPLRNHGLFFTTSCAALQDLDLHLLLAEQPLELPNPLMSFPQGTHRDDVLVRGDGRPRRHAA